jgi:hypothetical protein
MRDEAQEHVQHRRPAIAALEARRQRFEQPREHERQRLEILDRPFQIERRFEALRVEHRHERPDVLAARDRLPRERRAAHPRDEIRGREGREITERPETPLLGSTKYEV